MASDGLLRYFLLLVSIIPYPVGQAAVFSMFYAAGRRNDDHLCFRIMNYKNTNPFARFHLEKI